MKKLLLILVGMLLMTSCELTNTNNSGIGTVVIPTPQLKHLLILSQFVLD